ncbi:hypothetical protein AF332_12925 [Sporosarcina globispora]|uniref:Uncharacterized protein n=1 Tax=Sporosarcina globispora TaxID=1459 RepID=A0A0M0GD19_SPOGL|nr:hypothetical protein AF332_12925 [Sporosarcina globispora]
MKKNIFILFITLAAETLITLIRFTFLINPVHRNHVFFRSGLYSINGLVFRERRNGDEVYGQHCKCHDWIFNQMGGIYLQTQLCCSLLCNLYGTIIKRSW